MFLKTNEAPISIFFKLKNISIFKLTQKSKNPNLVALTEQHQQWLDQSWLRWIQPDPPLPLSLYLSLSLMLFFSFSSFTLFPYHQASPSSCHPAPPVVRLRRPWFPLSLPSTRIGGAPTRPPDPTASLPPTAARRPVHTRCKSAPTCTELYRVCVLACVRACRLDSSTIVHRTAHPEVAPRCRTGRRESCIPVTGCLLAPHCPPPTPGGGHLGAPNFLGSFFLESMEMAAQRSDSPQAQVETNGGPVFLPKLVTIGDSYADWENEE